MKKWKETQQQLSHIQAAAHTLSQDFMLGMRMAAEEKKTGKCEEKEEHELMSASTEMGEKEEKREKHARWCKCEKNMSQWGKVEGKKREMEAENFQIDICFSQFLRLYRFEWQNKRARKVWENVDSVKTEFS